MPFTILGRVQTREVRGGNKLVKVREFQVLSLPSETYFQFRRDATSPGYANPKPAAADFSRRIEAVMDDPRVVDVQYAQDTTAGGKLIDTMTTYYETVDGAVAGSVEQRLADFGPGKTIALVAAEIAAGGDQLGS